MSALDRLTRPATCPTCGHHPDPLATYDQPVGDSMRGHHAWLRRHAASLRREADRIDLDLTRRTKAKP